MDANRYQRVRTVFLRALDLPTSEREAFARKESGDDASIADEVLSLLARAPESGDPGTTSPGSRMRRHVEEIASDAENPDREGAAPMPERIGNCVVIRCLGEGGMGVVYEAEQQSPHRRVAIKLMRADFTTSSLAARFRREAELLGRLEHPGIARIYEAGKARAWGQSGPEVPYLVMELVDGTPLTAHAARHALSVADRLDLVAKICDALQHAHERGVVHRDLKPANVLVDANGQPRVLDFGVARALDADPQSATMHTGTSQLVGTLPYMSPEQLSGSGEVGPSSDVYALGVLAYELLAGRRPLALAGLSLAEAVRQVQDVEPAPLRSIDARLGGDVDAIVRKALAKEPERRYKSAGEMGADIERHLAEEPIQARPPSALYLASKFVRRNRALVAVAISLVAVLLAGVVATASLAFREARAKKEAVDALDEAQWAAHRADLGAALAALDDGDERMAARLIAGTPEPLRDWTWRHVASRLDDALASLRIDGVDNEAAVDQLFVRRDGAIVLGTRRGLVVVDTAGDELRFERRIAGEWVAISSDGRRALERREGRWLVHSTEQPEPPLDLGEAGSGRALSLDTGGWLVAAPSGARVHDASGAVLATLPGDFTEPLLATAGARWAACNRGDHLVAVELETGGREVPLGLRAHAIDRSSDGRRLLWIDRDGTLGTWEVGAREPVVPPERNVTTVRIERLAILPPGERIVTLDRRGALVTWSSADGARVRELASLGYSRHALAIRPDGEALLVSSSSGALQVMSLEGERFGVPRLGSRDADDEDRGGQDGPRGKRHEQDVTAVAFLPGQRIVSVDARGVMRLFTDPSAIEPRRLVGHGSYVYDVELDATGRRIASIAWDGTARTWDARTGQQLARIPLPGLVGSTIAWVGEDRFAASSEKSVTVYDLAGGADLMGFAVDGATRDMEWDAQRSRLLVLDERGRVTSWNPSTGDRRVLVEPTPTDGTRALGAGPQVAIVASGGDLTAFDPADGRVRWKVTTPCRSIGDIAVLGDDVAAACLDAVTLLLDARSGELLRRLDVTAGSAVYAVAFHPDGRMLATGSQDGLVSTWDLARGELVTQLRGHQDYVHALAFSPDGTLLVSASGDGTLRTWDSLPMRERFRRDPREARLAGR